MSCDICGRQSVTVCVKCIVATVQDFRRLLGQCAESTNRRSAQVDAHLRARVQSNRELTHKLQMIRRETDYTRALLVKSSSS